MLSLISNLNAMQPRYVPTDFREASPSHDQEKTVYTVHIPTGLYVFPSRFGQTW